MNLSSRLGASTRAASALIELLFDTSYPGLTRRNSVIPTVRPPGRHAAAAIRSHCGEGETTNSAMSLTCDLTEFEMKHWLRHV
jgi:hypothetical protein